MAELRPSTPAWAAVAGGDWSRLLGSAVDTAPPADPPARKAEPALQLIGVMASGSQGLALIAHADAPARVFRVGAVVHGDTVLKSVSPREVRLGPRDGSASTVLALPTREPGGAQPVTSASAAFRARADVLNDVSPIVPPHADMPTPGPAESGTPGSRWSELRTRRALPPGPAVDTEDTARQR